MRENSSTARVGGQAIVLHARTPRDQRQRVALTISLIYLYDMRSLRKTLTKIAVLLLFVATLAHSYQAAIKTGADQPEEYLPYLKGKRVAILAIRRR